jgi:hypothetical protein
MSKSLAEGQLVQMIADVSPWMDTIGVVLEDFPTFKDPTYRDSLVHVLYTDGRDIWTPFLFLKKVNENE